MKLIGGPYDGKFVGYEIDDIHLLTPAGLTDMTIKSSDGEVYRVQKFEVPNDGWCAVWEPKK